MTTPDSQTQNRVILSHFDGYSAALVFARWGKCLLLPEPLPESAVPMATPDDIASAHAGEKVYQAVISQYGFKPAELVREDDFDAWFQTDDGPLRVHLLRFKLPDAPDEAIEGLGGVFKSISELRGSAMIELNLLRQVFNLMVGGQRN